MIDYETKVTEHRRALHLIPELSFQEYKTTAYIRSQLEALSIDYMTPLETATIVYFEGQSNKTVGYRADIDALPIVEETGVSFESTHPLAMHACGHDGHAAILLTFAEWCKSQADQQLLPHNVLLIFQPSEESNAGAHALIKSFPFKDYALEGIFGVHLGPDTDEGVLLTKEGPLTASATEYRIRIKGRSAHVAEKETGANALGALSNMVNQIAQIQQYHLTGLNQNVIHIGKMDAGEAINTVASNGYLEGTIRTYSPNDLEIIKAQLQKILESNDQIYGTTSTLSIAEGYPPVINPASLLETVEKSAGAAGLRLNIKGKPYLFGEDFSFYANVAETNFAFLGIKNDGKGFTSGLHTATFNFDESALVYGVRYFQEILNHIGA
ncbi:M20 metallopeptidase family protein [Marinilactibacillus kalidii]|uniref:M20 metallopeptidase family protein n=1 Tax=Marinilactibacillus kalidii TaxID=2820274 RepID=UPI001ABEA7A4|nr:amidohydrolase [Marinilactibacillus kalidii]